MLLPLLVDHTATIQDSKNYMILRSVEVDYADSLAMSLFAWWIDDSVDTVTCLERSPKYKQRFYGLGSQDAGSKFDHGIAEIADAVSFPD